MKIRTQLVVAFLLLAVVPLTSLVLFSYFTSQRAVRRAVEAEAVEVTAAMDQRMNGIRKQLQQSVARLHRFPFRALLRSTDTEDLPPDSVFLEQLVTEMGDSAAYFDALTVVPRPPLPPEPPPKGTPLGAGPSEAPEAPEGVEPSRPALPLRIDVVRLMEAREATRAREEQARVLGEEGERAAAELGLQSGEIAVIGFSKAMEVLTHLGDEEAQARIEEELEAEMERRAEALGNHIEKVTAHVRAVAAVRAEERRQIEERSRQAERLLGQDLGLEVRDEGAVVADVHAEIKTDMMIHRILTSTPRDHGEIPFALDDEGRLYPAQEEDRPALESLELDNAPGTVPEATLRVRNDWMIVSTVDPETGLTFGVAHPIGDSLTEIRRTAARNFAVGLALVGLALLGILPLSRRITRGLEAVTEGAERIARGDLSTRVPVESKSEIGQLASAFNHMAEDLKAHQDRLVEEELRKRFLETEFQRKSRELEDARQFQISLLPKAVPEHPSFDIAVEMQTATEVGGDYYDFRLGEDGTLTLAVGDATGHGARAGTMVTVVKSLFSATAAGEGLAPFLQQAAQTVKRMELGRMAMALTVGRLRGEHLTISAAGMPPVLLYRAGSGEVEELALPGMPLGGLATEYEELEAELLPGDTLLFLSDGLPELANAEGEPLGYAAVRKTFAASASGTPEDVLEALTDAAASWTGGEPPSDDMTFLVIKKRVSPGTVRE